MLAVDKENFEVEVLQAEGLVLVDFWGPKCETCLAVMPDVEALAEKYGDKVKFCSLNTSGNRRLAISQKVLGLPVIAFYRNGEKIDELAKDDVNKENIETKILSLLA
ncbi:MAG TPA: thiol reductase thioredoxin [Firmicutes bacterium]|nr:thiol reductase thioredoxin [Bacillota bacterium]